MPPSGVGVPNKLQHGQTNSHPDFSRKFFRADALHLLFILALFVTAILIVGPIGEFPLNDDWVYARSVQCFLKTGHLSLEGSVAPCYLHMLIGAATSIIFGFSHQALRFLSLSWGLIAAVVFWLTARECGASRSISTLVTICLVFNPIFFFLSFAFMTDVPTIVLTNIFVLCVLKGVKSRSLTTIIVGSLFLDCAIGFRQLAVLISLPALLVLPVFRNSRKDMFLLLLSVVLVPIGLAYLVTALSMQEVVTNISMRSFKTNWISSFSLLRHHPFVWLQHLQCCFTALACYGALLSAPVLSSMLQRLWRQQLPVSTGAFFAISLLWISGVGALMGVERRFFPFAPVLMTPPWTCMMAILGTQEFKYSFWVSAISATLGLLMLVLLTVLMPSLKRMRALSRIFLAAKPDNQIVVLPYISLFLGSGLIATVFAVLVMVISRDFDRYYLPALAPLLLCLAFVSARLRVNTTLTLALPLTIFLFCYTTASVQDCLNGHRAKWKAIRELERSKISPSQIDGGWDYNMMYNFDLVNTYKMEDGQVQYSKESRGDQTTRNWRWWPINGEDYVISKQELDGYKVLKKYPFYSMVTRKDRYVYALVKNSLVDSTQK